MALILIVQLFPELQTLNNHLVHVGRQFNALQVLQTQDAFSIRILHNFAHHFEGLVLAKRSKQVKLQMDQRHYVFQRLAADCF